MKSNYSRPMFRRNEKGSVAITFAFALIPMVLAVGAAVDLGVATSEKAALQTAVDAAALAAAISGDKAEAAAQSAFSSHMPGAGATLSFSQPEQGLFQVSARKDVPTAFMKIVKLDSITINVSAEARAQTSGVMEVALVLDNTYSMVNDMGALKNAATALTEMLFNSAGQNQNFRMSVVPFVAAVNPGRALLEQRWDNLDYTGGAHWHGAVFRSGWLAGRSNCQPSSGSTSTTPTTPTSPTSPTSPGTPGKGAFLDSPLEHARRVAQELFGVTPALAQLIVTPNTIRPLSGSTIAGTSLFLPNGFSHYDWGGCPVMLNPTAISYFDLFKRIPSVPGYSGWKGCVEARTSLRDGASRDYDVTDDPPTSDDPNSKFVPYFWPDEPDRTDASRPIFRNDYLSDTNGVTSLPYDPTGKNSGWQFFEGDLRTRLQILLKYDGVTKPNLVMTGATTTGPNLGCPDELLPLTSDRKTVLDKINAAQAWDGGGTVVSEGLMWGWRTLSPNPPYATAKAYDGRNEKVIVLMSDGKNELGGNGYDSNGSLVNSPVYSLYNAYNYLSLGRFPERTFESAHAHLNDRLRTACANAKAKGIAIYTVLFRETDGTARQVMKDCASSPQNAYLATDATGLHAAFTNIAGKITRLRLSK